MTTLPNDLVLAHKAKSIIQREALTDALQDSGIEVTSSPRDMSRKVSDDTIDLSLEGYSVFFDGFAMYVKNRDKARADEVIASFMAAVEAADREQNPVGATSYIRKYFFCALFSIMLPILMHGFGLFHLVNAIRAGEKIRPLQFAFASALYLVTLLITVALIIASFY